MSGRLIILPHKRWHVWTTENIEKVKKDERLHEEEVTKNKKRERDRHLETLLSQLKDNEKKRTLSENNPNDDEEEGAEPSSRLNVNEQGDVPSLSKESDDNQKKNDDFDANVAIYTKDIAVNRDKGNEEYLREKEEKERLRKRREGSAPYQLVPDEIKKNTPWYMRKKTENVNKKNVYLEPASSLANDICERVEYSQKEASRRSAEDPMASFLQSSSLPSLSSLPSSEFHQKKESGKSGNERIPAVQLAWFERIKSSLGEERNHYSQDEDSDKKHKRSKRHKHQERDKKPKSRKSKSRSKENKLQPDKLDASTMSELRQRRLERERDARVKSDILTRMK